MHMSSENRYSLTLDESFLNLPYLEYHNNTEARLALLPVKPTVPRRRFEPPPPLTDHHLCLQLWMGCPHLLAHLRPRPPSKCRAGHSGKDTSSTGPAFAGTL